MTAKAGTHVVLIGCGNLAWHLAVKLKQLKYKLSVYNHRSNKELLRFKKIKCNVHSGLNQIEQNADLYFICVSDSAISKVSSKLRPENKNALVIHTAGARSINELKNKGGKKAVCYPLQSFSKTDSVNWREIPLLIEAEDEKTEKELLSHSKKISPIVRKVSSADRMYYHLSAVFVNNFVNALHASAEDLLNENVKKADVSLLDELSIHTLEKIFRQGARRSQTGPARRRDRLTMNAHKKLISKNTSLKKVYTSLSKLIEEQSAEN